MKVVIITMLTLNIEFRDSNLHPPINDLFGNQLIKTYKVVLHLSSNISIINRLTMLSLT